MMEKSDRQSDLALALEADSGGGAHFDQQFGWRGLRRDFHLNKGGQPFGLVASLPPAAEGGVVQSVSPRKLG